MGKDEEEKRRKIVRRIAIGMAERNGDHILKDVELVSHSEHLLEPRSEESLDARNPSAKRADGARYYVKVCQDGKGQINIEWPNGKEVVYKFWIPIFYLKEQPTPKYKPKTAKKVPKVLPKKTGIIVPAWVIMASSIMAFIAIFDLPYAYYQLLRWVVCGVAAAAAIQFGKSGRVSSAWVMGLLSATFNPLIPLEIEEETWKFVDALGGIVLFFASFIDGFRIPTIKTLKSFSVQFFQWSVFIAFVGLIIWGFFNGKDPESESGSNRKMEVPIHPEVRQMIQQLRDEEKARLGASFREALQESAKPDR